ncbi:hypothetical protein AAFC00_005600 [Neodothiora populina]|uniref:Inosine/uridine-preferring nucleoside hydrolase domain-containing protein n=1 Tax=Neodothiora populina TaxID=2781224 RepID=A0ABR3PLF7_9PEZI
MSPNRKIIIDTDPGVDDVLALLLAFSASPEELEVLLISLTFGNIDVENCLRNTVTLLYHVEREIAWRREQGKDSGFDALLAHKPIVAVGAHEPLADQRMMADYFHGIDGLGGIHNTHPHLTPAQTWKSLFNISQNSELKEHSLENEVQDHPGRLFQPSNVPAHEEILRLLRENEKDTITIVAVGPLTNIALAAAKDPETFLRVKEVIVMGSTLGEVGNITPVAEFNTYADSFAAARVYALTSPRPNSTIPPPPPEPSGGQKSLTQPSYLAPYPDKLSRQLNLTIFPLDITHLHVIRRGQFQATIAPLLDAGSPLAEWASAFLSSTFAKVESLQEGVSGDAVGLELHDPLCIWYALSQGGTGWTVSKDEDIRIETTGQWTRGMCVVDKRNRRRRPADDVEGEIPSDTGNWLSVNSGNRVGRCVASPGPALFAPFLLERVFRV